MGGGISPRSLNHLHIADFPSSFTQSECVCGGGGFHHTPSILPIFYLALHSLSVCGGGGVHHHLRIADFPSSITQSESVSVGGGGRGEEI